MHKPARKQFFASLQTFLADTSLLKMKDVEKTFASVNQISTKARKFITLTSKSEQHIHDVQI